MEPRRTSHLTSHRSCHFALQISPDASPRGRRFTTMPRSVWTLRQLGYAVVDLMENWDDWHPGWGVDPNNIITPLQKSPPIVTYLVSTQLKNIRQNGNLPQIEVKNEKLLKPPPSKPPSDLPTSSQDAIVTTRMTR